MLQLVRRGEGKRLLARPIVCRIFYSIRVAAFLPPRTFLGRRQYSFEALQQPEESVYNIVCVRVYIYTSRKGIVERSGNLGRLEIQFKTSRILAVVLIFRSIRPNFRPRERERPFRLDPRSSLRRTTRGKRWRRYPGDVAAAFQMLYPRVIDHAPLHVYIFRSMGVRLSSNDTEYRFLRTTQRFVDRGTSSRPTVLNFDSIFRATFNFQSPRNMIVLRIYGPLTLLELDLRRVSNYYQCSRVEYRNTKRRNSSFFDFCYFQARPTRYKDPRNKK